MTRRILILLLALAMVSPAAAESRWVFCKSYVNVRMSANKTSPVVGRLDACDEFETDGTVRNGFLKVYGVGENGVGWVFAGFTSEDRPEEENVHYVCAAVKRVACRRWIGGPRNRWLNNGSRVMVYYTTEYWCVTSRGYIAREWLDADP